MNYIITISSPDEWETENGYNSLQLSPPIAAHIADRHLQAIAQGRSDESFLAEVKAEFDKAYEGGWAAIERTMNLIANGHDNT
jgi:hypothetical protein